jgi:aspartate 1-decarboxylase
MSFAQVDAEEAKDWKPKVLVLSERNSQVVRADNVLVAENLTI